jgi:dTDP-4-dehydrorhamnose reductase
VTIGGSVLLVGPDGMLGRAWKMLLEERDIGHEALEYPAFDLRNETTVRKAISSRHAWVVNCAGWTDVDAAEASEQDATRVNGTGIGWLADACRGAGATLVHYSTDYVFDGQATAPYPVDAPLHPVNAYGRSKALGERLIVESGVRHLLLRTSWLYAPWGKNFVRTIIALSRQRNELKVVDDQRGRPTSAQHLAQASLALMDRGAVASGVDGIFHVTDGGACTWFEFARVVVESTSPTCRVHPCTSAEFPRPAPRPAYSILDVSKAERLVGPMPPWRENLSRVLASVEAP